MFICGLACFAVDIWSCNERVLPIELGHEPAWARKQILRLLHQRASWVDRSDLVTRSQDEVKRDQRGWCARKKDKKKPWCSWYLSQQK